MTDRAEYHRSRAAQQMVQAERTSNKRLTKVHLELAKFHKRAAKRFSRARSPMAGED